MTVGPFCTKVSCLLCHWASHYTLCLILLVHPMEALFLIKNSNTFTKILTSYRIIYRVSWKACYWWSTAAYKTSYPCLCSLQVGFCLAVPFKHMCLSHHQPWLMLKVIETLAIMLRTLIYTCSEGSMKCWGTRHEADILHRVKLRRGPGVWTLPFTSPSWTLKLSRSDC